MGTIKIEITCCLCSAKEQRQIELPGWTDTDVDFDEGFCPAHAAVENFRSAQCPGCVSSWKECGLWKGFAFERYRHNMQETLTERELEIIASGKCPRRINGTMSFSAGQMKDIDLSTPAEKEAGAALLAAIQEYWKRYPVCAPTFDPRTTERNKW